MRAFSSQDRSKLHSLADCADSLSTLDCRDWQLPLQSVCRSVFLTVYPFSSLSPFQPLWFDEPIVFLQPCREIIALDKYMASVKLVARPGQASPASSSNIFCLRPVLHLAVWQTRQLRNARTNWRYRHFNAISPSTQRSSATSSLKTATQRSSGAGPTCCCWCCCWRRQMRRDWVTWQWQRQRQRQLIVCRIISLIMIINEHIDNAVVVVVVVVPH